MGNFEKLVVLTVLFLAAIILGVTLHEDGAGRTDDPLGLTKGGPEDVAVVEPEVTKTDSNRGAMSSLVEKRTPKEAAKTPEVKQPAPKAKTAPKTAPKTRGKDSLFLTTAGLQKPAFGDEYLEYSWRSGDTIAAVAERYYGDRKLRYLIRNSNEGAAYRPGDMINLPFRDATEEAGTRPAFEPAPAHAAPEKVVVPANAPAKKVQNYTVQDGDSLWSIASDAYGKGTKWEQIFKANRDQLDDASDLKPGMVLRIP